MKTTFPRQTTPKQFEILVEFLQEHRELAVGFANSSEAKVGRRQMWTQLTEKLNVHGPPVRNCREWKGIWSDYKYNVKRKLAADLKLAKRKHWTNRLPFNKTEQAVIDLLEIKDKLVNFNRYQRKVGHSIEVAQYPLNEQPLLPEYSGTGSYLESDANQEEVIMSDDYDSKIGVVVINDPVEPELTEEAEYIETTDYNLNVSGKLEDTLMAMQKTQQAILAELKESNRNKKVTNKRKERLLQIEQDKFDEQKQQNYEKNKQAYIQIELKRKELELYELKLKGLCTQCTVKKEID